MKMRELNKENREKLALKRLGHSLIDRIKYKGYKKDYIYTLLANELGVPVTKAHFSQMQALREIRPAVAALERLQERLPKLKATRPIPIEVSKIFRLSDVPEKPKPAKKQRVKGEVLSRTKQLKAFEELRAAREAKSATQPKQTLRQLLASFFT